jgi:hypothetical protein
MFFKQKAVALPKSLEHWYGDLVAVDRLREVLEEPALQVAIATLCAAAAPSAIALVGTTGDHNAARLNWLAGYHDAFRDLVKLTRLPARATELPAEWSHIA